MKRFIYAMFLAVLAVMIVFRGYASIMDDYYFGAMFAEDESRAVIFGLNYSVYAVLAIMLGFFFVPHQWVARWAVALIALLFVVECATNFANYTSEQWKLTEKPQQALALTAVQANQAALQVTNQAAQTGIKKGYSNAGKRIEQSQALAAQVAADAKRASQRMDTVGASASASVLKRLEVYGSSSWVFVVGALLTGAVNGFLGALFSYLLYAAFGVDLSLASHESSGGATASKPGKSQKGQLELVKGGKARTEKKTRGRSAEYKRVVSQHARYLVAGGEDIGRTRFMQKYKLTNSQLAGEALKEARGIAKERRVA